MFVRVLKAENGKATVSFAGIAAEVTTGTDLVANEQQQNVAQSLKVTTGTDLVANEQQQNVAQSLKVTTGTDLVANEQQQNVAQSLKAGDSFRAKISVEGDKIILSKVDLSETSSGAFSDATRSVPVDNVPVAKSEPILVLKDESAIIEFLQNAGIQADYVSFKIIQAAQQMGVHIDLTKLSNVKALVKRFGINENFAAEIYVLLKEKGLDPTEENIAKVLNLILGKKGNSTFLKQVNKEKPNQKNWILLPIDYQVGSFNLSGAIMILKSSEKTVERINVRLISEQFSFFFVIYLQNEFNLDKIKHCKILFYVYPFNDEKKLLVDAKKYFELIAEDFEIQFTKEAMDGLFFIDYDGLKRVLVDA